MRPRNLWSYAHGDASGWEAICVDLDIAVQGRSLDEVRGLLAEAVETYVEDAQREAPAAAKRLLNRRAPWSVRVKFALLFLAHILSHGRPGREQRAGFDIPCPA